MRVRCASGAFSVRRFRLEDTAGLYAILSDPTVMRWIEPPYSMEQTASAHIAAKCGFTCIGQTDGLLTFRRKV